MKKIISTIIMFSMLAGTAAAQFNPNYRRYDDRMRVPTVQELDEARQDLIMAFMTSDVKAVDDILSSYPDLVNLEIKDKKGNFLPMSYYAFFITTEPFSNTLEQKLEYQKVRNEQINKYMSDIDKKIDRLAKKRDRAERREERRRNRYWFYRSHQLNDYEYLSISRDPFAPIKDIPWIILRDIAEFKADLSEDRAKNLDRRIDNLFDEKYGLQDEKGDISYDIKEIKQSISSSYTEMLKVFYKHGAECEQCFKDSIKKGKLTLVEEINISNYISKHGINCSDLFILDGWIDKWLPITQEVVVNSYNLNKFIFEAMDKYKLNDVLTMIRSDDPKTQQKIENYREALDLAYAQAFKGEPQIPSMEFPNISVVFLDKTYKPKTSSEVNKMITDIENVYNEESNAKLGQGETKPDTNLMRQKDKAIAELKKVRPHLVRYEEILQEQGNIENNNQKAKANADVIIMETTKMFGGSVDLVPLFLENFIYTNLRDWKYYPTGAELMGVKFHIPVIYNVRSDIAYDARPETFGNPQVVIVEMFGGNEHLASLFLKTFPKDNIRDWKYYPLGANLMDIDFQIPVIHNTKTGAVYDARLETFGKILVKANK